MTNNLPKTSVVISDDSDCQLRRTFWTRQSAEAAQYRMFERTGKARKIEPKCRYCKGWHLEPIK